MARKVLYRGNMSPHEAILTCWELLESGNMHKRAAAILYLKEIESYLVGIGRGQAATELRRLIKEEDRKRRPGLHRDGWMRP